MTELCLRAKAAHGYDEAFIMACRESLTVDPALPGVMVAEEDGRLSGVVQVKLSNVSVELEKLFVEPAHHGSGVGRRLLEWAMAEARARGARALFLDADPCAVAFYEHMGAKVVGQSPSDAIPGRTLPRLSLPLEQAAAPGLSAKNP